MSDPSRTPEAVPHEHHHLLVQAPVPAVDVDGIRVVTVGTVLFAVASILTALLYPRLQAEGRGWWLGVCVSGFVLGLVGLLYCWNRVRQRRRGTGPTAAGADPSRTIAP
ncbi:MAG: DUF2530 domain-containing protein [Friedmanniella sp.]